MTEEESRTPALEPKKLNSWNRTVTSTISLASAYTRLGRFDKPAGWILLLCPGLWMLALRDREQRLLPPTWPVDWPSMGKIVSLVDPLWLWSGVFLVGSILARAAGCVWNDLLDRKLDAQVERTRSRPLASGEIRPLGALTFLSLLLCVLFCIGLVFDWPARLVLVGGIPMVAVYPLMKRITQWPQVWLGLTFNWGLWVVTFQVGQGFDLLWLYAVLAGLCWTLAYDTIYAHQDRSDDELVGIGSTARALSLKTRPFVLAFLVGYHLFLVLCADRVGLTFPEFVSEDGGESQGTYLLLTSLVGTVAVVLTTNLSQQASCGRAFTLFAYLGFLPFIAFLPA